MFPSWQEGEESSAALEVVGLIVSAGVSAPPQREALQVNSLDQGWRLGIQKVKIKAWGFSKICAGGLPVQSEILTICSGELSYKLATI